MVTVSLLKNDPCCSSIDGIQSTDRKIYDRKIRHSLTIYENCCGIRTQVLHYPQRMPRIHRAIGEHHICDLDPVTPIICVCAVDAAADEVSVELGIVNVLALFDEEFQGKLEAKRLSLGVGGLVVAKLGASLICPLTT